MFWVIGMQRQLPTDDVSWFRILGDNKINEVIKLSKQIKLKWPFKPQNFYRFSNLYKFFLIIASSFF